MNWVHQLSVLSIPFSLAFFIHTGKNIFTLTISASNLSLFFIYIYSNAGGGGERVLWTAIRDIQRDFNNVICAVYTGDIASKEEIIDKVKASPPFTCFI
jgi:hypothetical protein